MKKHWYLPIIFIVLTTFYLIEPINIQVTVTSIFLTISTFLFAILTGFFISRQNNRYNQIREQVAVFDGNISAIYRSFGALGADAQKNAGVIISTHYNTILEKKRWDWHFKHKSTTITDLGELLRKTVGDKKCPTFLSQAVNHMIGSLDSLQISRKKMVSLQLERMPIVERFLVIFLAGILVFSLMLIPSESMLFGAFMKGVFGTLITLIVLLLFQLDSLRLFEGTIGESSANDILNIMAGKR